MLEYVVNNKKKRKRKKMEKTLTVQLRDVIVNENAL